MKSIVSVIALLACFGVGTSRATDLIVEEFGLPPTYSSITAAVADAVDGDRILIKNRGGNTPWIEDITIDKSIELLPFDNDSMFVVQGTYAIPSAIGREITIIGMHNLLGDITYAGGSAGTKATRLYLMSNLIESGDVVFTSAYEIDFVGNEISSGHLSMDFGSIIGNRITNPSTVAISGIYIYTTIPFTDDTLRIIGNIIENERSAYEGIYYNSVTQVFDIRNNFIVTRGRGIGISNVPNEVRTNIIHNNTILAPSGNSVAYGITLANIGANASVEIMNNVIDETNTGTTYGIYDNGGNSGEIYVYWNSIDPAFSDEISSTFTFSGNNNINSSFTLTADGHMGAGAPGINGGNPAPIFYDLDLTRNDAGCYGGSYTLDNFQPLFTGSARVYFVDAPTNVRQGNAIKVTGKSYDR